MTHLPDVKKDASASNATRLSRKLIFLQSQIRTVPFGVGNSEENDTSGNTTTEPVSTLAKID